MNDEDIGKRIARMREALDPGIESLQQRLETLDPSLYAGQDLCPRCGNDGTKRRFPVCAERKSDGRIWSHSETCVHYRYSTDMCDECELVLQDPPPVKS